MSLETRLQAFAQAVGLDIKALSNQGFIPIPIWMEENGNLSANNRQWSAGNGAVGNCNIPMIACEVYAIGLASEVGGTSVSIDLMVDDVAVATETMTGQNDLVMLSDPLPQIADGQVLGFRTNTVVGTYTDARVIAWCRVSILGLKGDPGAAGAPGNDGIPSACARIEISQVANVNVTTPVDVPFNQTTFNTIAGSTLNATTFSVPEGNYKVTFDRGFDASNGQRTSIGLNFMKDAALYSRRRSGNYIRFAGGHNFAGDSFTDLYSFGTGGGTIGLQCFREDESTATNALILEAATSIVLIQKLS